MMVRKFAAIPVVLGCFCGTVLADDAPPNLTLPNLTLTLKDHQFTPTELHVETGKPVFLAVVNQDETPEEFEMRPLAIEKVIPGGGHAKIRLRPLGPGQYPFIGEFNELTAKGVIIVDAAPGAKE